jgi:hypothetical protein
MRLRGGLVVQAEARGHTAQHAPGQQPEERAAGSLAAGHRSCQVVEVIMIHRSVLPWRPRRLRTPRSSSLCGRGRVRCSSPRTSATNGTANPNKTGMDVPVTVVPALVPGALR